MNRIYTVSQINRYIKGLFSSDVLLSSVAVRGEVSNLKYHHSGHIYFSLKDRTGTISCVMFAGKRAGLTFRMQEGDTVVILGTVDVFERDGRYQLYADEIRKEGMGALYERFLALKAELEETGMFDQRYKKPVGKYNFRIGIVTAPGGAAIRDIENIAARRNPFVDLILYPALVQGAGAKESIAAGIEALNEYGADVIIVCRGGGSIEDLWAFNEELVACAIFASEIPVISAVGHETDTTIADLVADLRAPTPSAAAELAVFDLKQFDNTAYERKARMDFLMNRHLRTARTKIREHSLRAGAASPAARIREQRMRALRAEETIQGSMDRILDLQKKRVTQYGQEIPRLCEERLSEAKEKLRLYLTYFRTKNPLDYLAKGYVFAKGEDGRAVSSIGSVQKGSLVTLLVPDGKIETTVLEAAPYEKGDPLYGRGTHH